MRRFNLLFYLAIVFIMFGCVDPGQDPDNPDLRVINGLENYKISEIKFNNQVFTGIGEYLMPGDTTEYMKVAASPNIMLSYRWEHVNNPGDNGETGTLFVYGDPAEFKKNEIYTISITGDKELPLLYLYQP